MNLVKKILNDFKDFVQEAGFVSVAIGFLVATAVKDLTNSLFNNIVTPILNRLLELCGVQTTTNMVNILGIKFGIAEFVSSIFTFIFMLLIAFVFLKVYNFIVKDNQPPASKDDEEIELLKEILAAIKGQEQEKDGNNICND